MWITDIEVLRLHYAETLRAWRDNFNRNRAEIARVYDEQFCRMWEFYLIGSELSFRYDFNMVWQMQMARDIDAVPVTRNYMFDWGRRAARPKRCATARPNSSLDCAQGESATSSLSRRCARLR